MDGSGINYKEKTLNFAFARDYACVKNSLGCVNFMHNIPVHASTVTVAESWP